MVLLHHVLARLAMPHWVPEEEDEASHLCHNATCAVVGHVVWEHRLANKARINCTVWSECDHDDECKLRTLHCRHTPYCIRSIEGVDEKEMRAHPEKYFHRYDKAREQFADDGEVMDTEGSIGERKKILEFGEMDGLLDVMRGYCKEEAEKKRARVVRGKAKKAEKALAKVEEKDEDEEMDEDEQ